MKDLVNAVVTSLDAESFSDGWTFKKHDPLWRNPAKGKVCNVYSSRRIPGPARTTQTRHDIVEVVIEYAEPSGNQPRNLERDEAGELAAEDVADNLTAWTAKHEGGFTPAWQMRWAGTDYVPNVRRELFSRYCRIFVHFTVQVVLT